jgi:hypothetical protein
MADQVFRCPDSNCRAHTQPGKLAVNHVMTCGFNDWDADDIRAYHKAPQETASTHVDLVKGEVNISIGDRRTLEAFAAFLRYAGPVGARRVPLHPEWHAWMTGKGPTPDPDSEVGPEPYVAPAPEDPFANCRDRCQQVGLGRCNCA